MQYGPDQRNFLLLHRRRRRRRLRRQLLHVVPHVPMAFACALYTQRPTSSRMIIRVMRVITKIIRDEMGELSGTEIAPSGSRGDAVDSAGVAEEWGPLRRRSWRSCRQNDLGTPLPCECCGPRQAIRTLLETPPHDAPGEHRRRRHRASPGLSHCMLC